MTELAPYTTRSYVYDWRSFVVWSAAEGLEPLDVEGAALARYLVWLEGAEYAPSSILRAAAGVQHMLRRARPERWQKPPAEVAVVMERLRRAPREEPIHAEPVTSELLGRMVVTLDDTVCGARDRALLLVGFVGALRPSDLVALDVDDVGFDEGGIELRLRRGRVRSKYLPSSTTPTLCPRRALRRWLDVTTFSDGPLFRSFSKAGVLTPRRLASDSVREVLQARARRLGMSGRGLGGDSLRVGFIVTAAGLGCSLEAIRLQTGHASVADLEKYITTPAPANAAKGLL